jgi:hypothetical protein
MLPTGQQIVNRRRGLALFRLWAAQRLRGRCGVLVWDPGWRDWGRIGPC